MCCQSFGTHEMFFRHELLLGPILVLLTHFLLTHHSKVNMSGTCVPASSVPVVSATQGSTISGPPTTHSVASTTSSRPHRNAGPPSKYSPSQESGRARPKPYSLNRVKVLSSKEEALDRPYTPDVTLKEGGNLVIVFQAMVFEAFKQAVHTLETKSGYSISMPKASNQPTADGLLDSNSLQINIGGRKAYIMNFYHTTCKVNVNGHRMRSAFVEEDFQFLLNSISGSGITPRHIYLMTNAAREAIGKAKKLSSPTLLEIEGSIPARDPGAARQSGTKSSSSSDTTPSTNQQFAHTASQPLLAANHIPMLQHSSPPVTCPVLPSHETHQTPTSIAPLSLTTSTGPPVSTMANTIPVTSTTSSIGSSSGVHALTIRPNAPVTSNMSTTVQSNPGQTFVVRLPCATSLSSIIPPGIEAIPRVVLQGGVIDPARSTEVNGSMATNTPALGAVSAATATATSSSSAPSASSSAPSAASTAGAKARAEIHALEKAKRQLKEKQRELDDMAAQVSRSKAIALDMEAKLKETQESLRIRDQLETARQDDRERGRYSRRDSGIDGNWRDACRTENKSSRRRQEQDNRDDRSNRSYGSDRSRYSSGGHQNRSHNSGRHDRCRDYHDRCCCPCRCNGSGGNQMESRMALMEAKLNDLQMQELERRLRDLERPRRQRGRQRPRRRRRSGDRVPDEGRETSEHVKHNQGMYNTRSFTDSNLGNLTSHVTPKSPVLQSQMESSQQGSSGPATSSPVPRGPPIPPFRADELGDLDVSEATQSSEPSDHFLETTVLPNRSR